MMRPHSHSGLAFLKSEMPPPRKPLQGGSADQGRSSTQTLAAAMPLGKTWTLGKSPRWSRGSDAAPVSLEDEDKGAAHQQDKRLWNTDAQFVLAAIGSAVGLGNFLRFPSLAHKYGGFAFLVPYILAVFVIGIPMMGQENALGQMTQRSALPAFAKISPPLWGLGAFATWGAFLVLGYYQVIMSWTLIYIVYSCRAELPWGTNVQDAQDFFWEYVLRSKDPDTGAAWSLDRGTGPIVWQVAVALLVQWLFVFLATNQLHRSIQRIVLVTVPVPFILIFILLIYGLTKEGASAGVRAYVDPTAHPEGWSALLSLDPWVDAAGQIFFGLSLGVGVMIAYSSHQRREAKIVRNTWIIVGGNSATSLVSGFAVFALLGHFSSLSNQPLEDVASAGFVLAFATFPAAFASFEGNGIPQIFSVLFFLMLLLLGLDSAMSLLEACAEVSVSRVLLSLSSLSPPLSRPISVLSTDTHARTHARARHASTPPRGGTSRGRARLG